VLEETDERPSALRRGWERLMVVLGRGGLVLLAIAIMLVVLVLVLLVLSWFTGLGPEGPSREHY
jgi:hypothetical protein